jgi:phosphate transport system protein
MITHLQMEIEAIKTKIFEMADCAIESITQSIGALKNSDMDLAAKVIENEKILDKFEIELDEECVKLLVTRQPAAADMRLILSFIKINTDLEKIGDFSTIIALETINNKGKPFMKPLVDIPRMAQLSIEMIRESFQSISEKNPEIAERVIQKDNEIDLLNDQVNRELLTYIAEDTRLISQAFGLITIAKALEKIGDHATNIAERAIYYIKGIDVRHGDLYK